MVYMKNQGTKGERDDEKNKTMDNDRDYDRGSGFGDPRH